MDEDDLPPILPLRPKLTRKRTRTDDETITSSDPAMFSSDEHAPSAENYDVKRRKDQWHGTWWGTRAAQAKRIHPFRRNYDSGIFMNSDETDASLEDELLDDMNRETKERVTKYQRQFQRLPDFQEVALEKLPKPMLVSPLHHQVRGIIQKCLEQGNENVDLSSMSLQNLPPDIVSLKSLIKHSNLSDSDFTKPRDAYSSIEAHLRLFLSRNAFTRLPSEVLDLTNLTFLSLRQNNLTEIPPGIRQLVRLETLNISGNKLRRLPFEVLELVHTRNLLEIVASANPWDPLPESKTESPNISHRILRQEPSLLDVTHDGPSPVCLTISRLATSVVEHLRKNGTIDRSFTPTNSPETQSRAPGLAEIALRRISKLQSLANVDDWLPEELPETVVSMMKTARDVQTSGSRQCTTCGQNIILPQTQWTEWWSISSVAFEKPCSSETLPFLRFQCHSTCLGDKATWAREQPSLVENKE